MQPIEVKKDIYWVGAIDWDIRDFHGYSTPKGTSYNAYLVLDDKITLFDTVKKPFAGELTKKLTALLSDVKRIDYIIVNHVEMDHSGALPEIMELARPEKLICSPMAKKALLEHYHREDWPYEVVGTGQSVSIGRRTVQFLETRMLHWPDSMFSYIPEERLLISSDAFGEHWATSERFDDEVDQSELMAHAAKYYSNILLLYSPLVQKLLEKVRQMNLAVDMIVPDHGLIWRTNPVRILEAYDAWSVQKSRPKAVIVYDTMWHSTEMMAKAIADGIVEQGVSIKLMDLSVNHRSDVMTELLDAKALVVGSPTLNNGMLPRMADMLTYMKGLKPGGKIAAAFGSFGWSGESVKLMTQSLEEMKMKIIDPGLQVKFVPSPGACSQCFELGRKIGRAVMDACRSERDACMPGQ